MSEYNMDMNEDVAKFLFYGIVSDTNRFLFNSGVKTFNIISKLIMLIRAGDGAGKEKKGRHCLPQQTGQ